MLYRICFNCSRKSYSWAFGETCLYQRDAWQYPSLYTDTQDIDIEQPLPVAVESEWDFADPGSSVLSVKNAEDINVCFAEFI